MWRDFQIEELLGKDAFRKIWRNVSVKAPNRANLSNYFCFVFKQKYPDNEWMDCPSWEFSVRLSRWEFSLPIFPSRHFLIKSQQWKQQNNVWIRLQVNKDSRTTSDFTHCFCVSIVDFEQENAGWEKIVKKFLVSYHNAAGIYLFKVNNGNIITVCKICSKLTIKTERSGVFIVNFEQISHIVLVFPLLTLNI